MNRRVVKKVTIKDVAAEAGVSRALVSIAYRGVAGVSEKTAKRIFEVGKRLGYVPNLNAARLASKQIKSIGVFLQDLHNEVFADVYDGIREVLDAELVQVVLAVGSAKPGFDSKALNTLIASQVDVVIAAGLTMSDAELKGFAKRTKLISVTRKCNGVASVVTNDYVGSQLAVNHLIEQGHKRIGFLANPQTDGYRERLRGYQDSVTASGLRSYVQETTYDRLDAETDVVKLLDEKVSAVFAHNDLTALGVLDALVSSGLKPGVDIAVVGFDNTSLSQAPILALTTVDSHSLELGKRAAKLAIDSVDSKLKVTQVELTPTLVVRASSSKG